LAWLTFRSPAQQSAARIVEQFNLDSEEVEFLTGALQHEQCACLQQELPRQKEAWKAFQQQVRPHGTANVGSAKNDLKDVVAPRRYRQWSA
jgi:hypothetical protein